MRAVNLLPKDAGRQTRISQKQLPVVVGGGLGLVVVGALGMSMLSAKAKLDDANQAYQDAQQQLASTPKPPPPVQPSAAETSLASEDSARVAALSAALGLRTPWDRILRELSLVLPGDVKLTGLSMSTANGAPSVNISGYTYSHDAVARLLSRLQTIPEFGTPSLPASTRTVSQGVAQVTFSIAVPLAGAAPAAPAAAPAPAPAPTTTSTTTTTTTSTTPTS
jgi:Tfp pilus assembly protein PilN